MTQVTRRRFLRDGLTGVGAVACSGSLLTGAPTRKSATDLVTLGRSGIKVTRLGIGTGTRGGRVQRDLGQDGFTRLLRYAYDRGIRFFDTADSYRTHEMVGTALKGIDRDSYFLQTKMGWRNDPDPFQIIDRFRKELQTDYFDSLLLHCTRTGDWKETLKRQMDLLEEAKQKQLVRTHGASCHGLLPLEVMPGTSWLDVALVRVNHNGAHMDGLRSRDGEQGDRDRAVTAIRKIHQSGTGVIGMKIMGEGDFTDPQERDASIKYVMSLDCVDAVVIGFASPAEIDEAIERMNRHLNA
ncbi:MAG TPA: aldo/keto reductase [Acidobacteriota bacterium]|nr:aldo/keto reductase [Acidobacteriota bacterium]